MKSAVNGVWKALGFTGRLLVFLTVLYFMCITFKQ